MAEKKDIKIQCTECGADFIFTVEEQTYYAKRGYEPPKRCKPFRKIKKARYEMQRQMEADILWQEQEERRIAELLPLLPYRKLEKENLNIEDGFNTLYIIGNGFDIMHDVPSRYSDFRDSMGKNNSLRQQLETYIKSECLWSDFEEALAHIDGGAMLGVVDMWMDIYDAYNPDAQAADYFMAIDTATSPAQEMLEALPRRFRQWVETLKPTKGPAWMGVLHKNGKYLNFNYTEFLETLYEIPSEQITYIHGCRKNKKQELILGHAPGAGDDDDWTPSISVPRYKSRRKAEMLDGALDTASRQVGWFDEGMAKKTDEIIAKNHSFFTGLSDMTTVAVIGHSLSAVDYPYFEEIIKYNGNKASWIITWYSSRDLENIQTFIKKMGMKDTQITIVK